MRWLRAGRWQWEYGTCRDMPARRHCRTGEVQFVMWKAGEQGHAKDYWHQFHPYWWDGFAPTPTTGGPSSTESAQ
jgi:hypothetical protein